MFAGKVRAASAVQCFVLSQVVAVALLDYLAF